MSLYVVRKAALDDLAQRAARAYPASRSLQARWLKAVKFLRRRPTGSIWIMDTPTRRKTA
jgi:hypothetical protein